MFFSFLLAATAVSHLVSSSGSGEVTLTEKEDGVIAIDGKFEGLTPGRHVLQLHAEGCSAVLKKSAGAHFNPLPMKGCDPTLAILELGEIEASSDGTATFEATLEGVHLSGADSIVGHSLVLHPVGMSDLPPSCGAIQLAD